MLHTYKARLNHHQLEWLDAPPELVSLQPVMVFVTFLEEPTLTQTTSGPRMAEILQQMAENGREKRPLPNSRPRGLATRDSSRPSVAWERGIMLIDSNIIIYSIKPEHASLRQFIADQNPLVLTISYLEVLGYHQLTLQDQQDFEKFFQVASLIPVSFPILQRAVILRQQAKMSLEDAIIAGTALEHGLTLVTANVKDFQRIPNLKVINPVPVP